MCLKQSGRRRHPVIDQHFRRTTKSIKKDVIWEVLCIPGGVRWSFLLANWWKSRIGFYFKHREKTTELHNSLHQGDPRRRGQETLERGYSIQFKQQGARASLYPRTIFYLCWQKLWAHRATAIPLKSPSPFMRRVFPPLGSARPRLSLQERLNKPTPASSFYFYLFISADNIGLFSLLTDLTRLLLKGLS